jgi:muramidase (phage lysozyme)
MKRLLGVALVAGVVATGCLGPVENWVPDFNKDGKVSDAEVSRQTKVIEDGLAALDASRRNVQLHPFLTCVRAHESDRSGYPHTRGYTAQNPRSSASGAYQFIDSTWRTVSAQAGYPGYSKAKYAPWYIQDAVTLHVFNNGGRSHWRGTGC